MKILELLESEQWLYGGARDVPEVGTMLQECADKCFEINGTPPSLREKRMELFRNLLGSTGERFVIHSPFRCDFGFNIHIGENFIGNFNLAILDEAPVRIGRNVMIGPNCTLTTITHALDAGQRAEGVMRARSIEIYDNAWLASNVTVLPGVTIGVGAVIGAGSVVTKSIAPGMLAVGNPCREVRPITDSDRIAYVAHADIDFSKSKSL